MTNALDLFRERLMNSELTEFQIRDKLIKTYNNDEVSLPQFRTLLEAYRERIITSEFNRNIVKMLEQDTPR